MIYTYVAYVALGGSLAALAGYGLRQFATTRRYPLTVDVFQLKYGQVCRTSCGKPARYLGEGKAAYMKHPDYVAVATAAMPDGNEDRSKLPGCHYLCAIRAQHFNRQFCYENPERDIADRTPDRVKPVF